jgi:hypothetical protein
MGCERVWKPSNPLPIGPLPALVVVANRAERWARHQRAGMAAEVEQGSSFAFVEPLNGAVSRRIRE